MSGFERRVGTAFEDANVLLTGCSGFVGTYLMKRLVKLGANVFGLDRWKSSSTSGDDRDHSGPGAFHWMSGDLLDMASLANIIDHTSPTFVIHLGAQSYVPESFLNPIHTTNTNIMGTVNLLEVLRQKESDARVVFAGSSEEYGLVFHSKTQLQRVREKYGTIFPEPTGLPELPIRETNPLRPMSPYAVSKVAGDYLMRNYYHSFGLKTVVSRAFNHEGAGRGPLFVTSVVTKQVMGLVYGETEEIVIGDVTAFRDWSHVSDIVDGYILLLLDGKAGEVYNQGSQRTNCVLSYILLALEAAKIHPKSLKSISGSISVDNPLQVKESSHFGMRFETTEIDRMLLNEELDVSLSNKGFIIETDSKSIRIAFNPARFRPSDVPILLSSAEKIHELGFSVRHSLMDIVNDQLNFYLDAGHRRK